METVLVVEDSRVMQRTLQRLFESDGLQVRLASDGVAGLESFKKETPNAVVLDLKLPRLPGKEVCRAFKAHAASVPIVVLSANTAAQCATSHSLAGFGSSFNIFTSSASLTHCRFRFRNAATTLLPC